MATPMTAAQYEKALKAEGVKVSTYYSGWKTHNRNHKGAWGPVNGVVIHHTAGVDSRSFCYNGNASLPGPLCHGHLAKSGTLTLIGWGRANHAGTFAANAFNAMVAESKTHPRPDASEPIDANSRTYGLEIENLGNGKDPYPAVQYDQAVRWAAALCRHHGWTEHSVIGHKEGTRRKIDPSFSMDTFRKDVAERLKHAASWNPGSTGGSDNSGGKPVADQTFRSVVQTDAIPVPRNWDPAKIKDNPNWTLATYVRDLAEYARRNYALLNEIVERLDRIEGK